MNNRQAALLAAASSVSDSSWGKSITKGGVARRIVDNARVFELWLDTRDHAAERGEPSLPFDAVQTIAPVADALERDAGSPIAHVDGYVPAGIRLTTADGRQWDVQVTETVRWTEVR